VAGLSNIKFLKGKEQSSLTVFHEPPFINSITDFSLGANTFCVDGQIYQDPNSGPIVGNEPTFLSGNGSLATTLTASGVSSGTYGSSTAIPVLTVDTKGRITTASTVGIIAGVNSLNYTSTTTYAAGGTISGTTLTLAAADGTNPGLISTGTQTITGAKTFSNDVTATNFLGNATTATTAGNITATSNTTLTSLSNLNTVGTITSGTWNGTAISDSYISSSVARLNSPTFTGTVLLPATTSIGDVSNIEIGYLDGVTSGIQTQLNGKASSLDLSALQTQVNGKLDSSVASTTYAPLASPTFTGTVTLTSATVVGLVGVPSQTSHSGKYLTTDGTNPSWSAINSLKYSATAPSSPAVGDIWVESDVDVTGLDPHHYV
jgi:hypothetical protein